MGRSRVQTFARACFKNRRCYFISSAIIRLVNWSIQQRASRDSLTASRALRRCLIAERFNMLNSSQQRLYRDLKALVPASTFIPNCFIPFELAINDNVKSQRDKNCKWLKVVYIYISRDVPRALWEFLKRFRVNREVNYRAVSSSAIRCGWTARGTSVGRN